MSAIERYNDKMSPVHGGRSAAMRAYAKLGNDIERNVKVQDIALWMCRETTITARLVCLKLSTLAFDLTDAETAFLRHFI